MSQVPSVCTPDYDTPIKEILCRALQAAHEYDDSIGMSPVADPGTVIHDWDMSIIKQFMVEKGIYPAEEINALETEYKRWLNLAVLYRPYSVPISEKVDAFWHTHILFTQDYTAMSYAATGKYLHHRPAILDKESDLKAAFIDHTFNLYRKHYGEPNPKYWDKVMCTCQIGD